MNDNRLLSYFSRVMELSEEESRAIAESMDIRSYPKGEILLREEQVSRECYFVLQGCVRLYYLRNGEEKTGAFYTEDDWVLSLASFTQKIPAGHYLECAEDTLLVAGTEQKENDLYKRFPRFETISRKVMERIVALEQARIASYQTDSPEQRYLKLLESRPGLLQRVPQYQLASYIGVRPESLSRIRKRISLQKD